MTVSFQIWKDGAAPMAWAGPPGDTRIYFNRRRVEGGVFDGWSAYPDGSGEVCHTDIAAYPRNTHAGIGDVTPDGKYALVTVERSNHWPMVDGDEIGAPGRGTYNNLWLLELATGKTWKLRDILVQKTNALIWPRFNTKGTKVVWSELVTPALIPGVIGGLGEWRMHVADLSIGASSASLVNIRTVNTKGLMEAYGFSSDGSHILFAGDKIVGKELDALTICEIPSILSGDIKQISPKTPVGYWANYNEFAYYIPGTNDEIVLFARTVATNGLDYWITNRDGSNVERITFFGSSDGAKSIAGGLAFNPEDNAEFVAGFALDDHDKYTSRMLRF